MKDVEPFAPSLNCVLRVSSNEATKRNVASGHQPGKASRLGHRLAAQAIAASATTITKKLIRAVRDMRRMGIPVLSRIYAQVGPSPPPIIRAIKAATDWNKPPFNIERYLP
jgi:hypothetical protein